MFFPPKWSVACSYFSLYGLQNRAGHEGPVTSCQGIKIFLSWAMVMGRQQGRVGSSGVSGLLRVVCEEELVGSRYRCCGRDRSPSFDANNDPWPRAPTCRRTLAVSSGKVRRSAKQAAMPAPRNFTAVVGGISEGFSPTMVPDVSSSPLRASSGPRREQPWALVQGGGCGDRLAKQMEPVLPGSAP